MAPTFEEILRSDHFTFLIGERKEPVVVHKEAFAAISEPMKSMMNLPMSESETRRPEIPGIEVEDFVRFCEYAYRGDYSIPRNRAGGGTTSNQVTSLTQSHHPEPKISIAHEVSFAEEQRGELSDSDGWNPRWKKKGKGRIYSSPSPQTASKKSILRKQWNDRKFAQHDATKSQILGQSVPVGNTSMDQDFTPVFLGHARLYRFADEKLVAPLKALALHKLHCTLKEFKIYNDRVGDVLELARYAYSNDHTPDRAADGSIDELRQIVVEYIACEIDVIGKTEEFAKLMEEGGEFVGDFWGLAKSYLI